MQHARTALSFIPNDDRDIWLKMAMAIKSEFGEEGFDMWDAWSSTDPSYKPADAKAVWKSANATKTTIASLFFEAKKYGYKPDKTHHTPTHEELAERAAKREQAHAAMLESQNQAAIIANQIWAESTPCPADYPYLAAKGIQTNTARITDNWPGAQSPTLIIPLRKDKKIVSLQAIFPDGQKRFLSGGEKKGCYFSIGKPIDNKIIICEGFSTGASIHECTGHAVIIAFDCGNLLPVAESMRASYPGIAFIIAADNDQFTSGNPGIKAATAAANAIGASVIHPEFKDAATQPTDFNDLHQLEGAQAVADTFTPRAPVTIQQPPVEVLPTYLTVDYHSELPNVNDKLKPLATIENLEEICLRHNVSVRYNVISKEIEILIPNSAYTVDNNAEACISWLTSECAKFKMPSDKIRQFLITIADSNQYNPVSTWINSIPWDGLDRLTALNNSLGSVDPAMSAILLKKWMVGAIEAVYNPNGISNSSVLVLQGEQYAGKTAWFWSLTNHNKSLAMEGSIINPSDKDSVMGAIRYWLVELGELDATFRKSDIAQLKAFITKDADQLRRPYAATFSNYPRRTVFFASVNPKHYLHDETGNRRFWTVECTSALNPNHGIDMQQAWAQVRHMHLTGASWKLTREELTRLNESNDDYQSADPIEELILLNYDTGAIDRPSRLSSSDVLISIGYDRPTPQQSRTCASILRKYFGDSIKSNGRKVFALPIKLER